MNVMSLTRLYMHVVPNLSPSSNILDIRCMLLIFSAPPSNTTSLNKTDHESMNTSKDSTMHIIERQENTHL